LGLASAYFLEPLSHDKGHHCSYVNGWFSGGCDGELFEVAVLFQQHDLAFLVAEDKTAVSHPGVAGDVGREVA